VGRSGRFEKLATIATDERGVFRRRVADAAGRRWRLVWTSPQGTTFRGPPTRAHAR